MFHTLSVWPEARAALQHFMYLRNIFGGGLVICKIHVWEQFGVGNLATMSLLECRVLR
jgi:hypothetical protein